jgi:hypothetical protein
MLALRIWTYATRKAAAPLCEKAQAEITILYIGQPHEVCGFPDSGALSGSCIQKNHGPKG